MTEPFQIRALEPSDAERLTACFRRCYGDSYVAGFFYDPTAIRERVADGRLRSVVAVAPTGEVVGHMGLTRRHPEARTVEAGNTVVDPSARGHGLAAKLGAALFGLCRDAGYVGFHHYPTTAHPIMQRLAVDGGGVETGVMLAYVPAETDYRDLGGRSAKGRLAVVTVYQPLAPAPERDVFLPERFASLLRTLYERARLVRRVLAPGASGAADAASIADETRLAVHTDAARSLVRIDAEALGRDASDRIVAAAASAASEVTHVDLPLSDPAAPRIVEELREADFFFCALLPEFAATDVLRLQHLRSATPEVLTPDLVHSEARAILQAALADRNAARDFGPRSGDP